MGVWVGERWDHSLNTIWPRTDFGHFNSVDVAGHCFHTGKTLCLHFHALWTQIDRKEESHSVCNDVIWHTSMQGGNTVNISFTVITFCENTLFKLYCNVKHFVNTVYTACNTLFTVYMYLYCETLLTLLSHCVKHCVHIVHTPWWGLMMSTQWSKRRQKWKLRSNTVIAKWMCAANTQILRCKWYYIHCLIFTKTENKSIVNIMNR